MFLLSRKVNTHALFCNPYPTVFHIDLNASIFLVLYFEELNLSLCSDDICYIVAGASARATARSIIKSGAKCEAIDLFGDWDTRNICHATQVESMQELSEALQQLASTSPLVLAGGGENLPFVIEDGPLNSTICGSSFEAIRLARDPFFVRDCLLDDSLPALDVQRSAAPETIWIKKPYRSAGGHRVSIVDSASDDVPSSEFYYQQQVAGELLGAIYVANQDCCHLIGCSRQFTKQLGDDPFAWHSAISTSLPDELVNFMEKTGGVISDRCGLRGWFGIDFIQTLDGVFLLEVNPRYTSTMEIRERQADHSLFPQHMDAVRGSTCSNDSALMSGPMPHVSKSYMYNGTDRNLIVDQRVFDTFVGLSVKDDDRFITDIPICDSIIGPNHPICSIWSIHDRKPQIKNGTTRKSLELTNQIELLLVPQLP